MRGQREDSAVKAEEDTKYIYIFFKNPVLTHTIPRVFCTSLFPLTSFHQQTLYCCHHRTGLAEIDAIDPVVATPITSVSPSLYTSIWGDNPFQLTSQCHP